MLPDRAADSIALDYDAGEPTKFFLIAPDGRLVARDLVGAQLEAAVARFLVKK